jgi:hypothetical protein
MYTQDLCCTICGFYPDTEKNRISTINFLMKRHNLTKGHLKRSINHEEKLNSGFPILKKKKDITSEGIKIIQDSRIIHFKL